MNLQSVLQKPTKNRNYVPIDFQIDTWENLNPIFLDLLSTPIESLQDLEQFLLRVNEVQQIISEEMAWRYIRMTCDTENQVFLEHYQYLIQEIYPLIAPYSDKLNRKIYECPFFHQLDATYYKTYIRSLKTQIELFREENIPLIAEEQTTAQGYAALMGRLTITYKRKKITFQQAAQYLESSDRKERETVWRKMNQRRKQDWDACDTILTDLIRLRTQQARHAGYDSYTDYKFISMGRFDYTRQDCERFHQSVETVVKPLIALFAQERKEKLGLDTLRPWDMGVDIFGDTPLRPFHNGKELVEKSISILKNIRPELGQMLEIMKDAGYLDVESRIGKAPGGYNYPLAESGVPFIFMNAAGTHSDVNTMLHESGHAIHSFVSRNIALSDLRETPAEMAEVASMTMELFAMDGYNAFYDSPKELLRAQKDQILGAIMTLPWVATVDAFQHWLYDNPTHSLQERHHKWTQLYDRFHGNSIDWSRLQDYKTHAWMRQLHIFEVPFYYIEYAFAQMGAIAIWRNYKNNPQQALNQYLEALSLGYTRTLPELYAAAGIAFDFSPEYTQNIINFCKSEYEKLVV